MEDIQDPQNFIKQLQIELEHKNQALYDYERQKKTAEALVQEYQEEIRILQSDGILENKKLEAKIQQLEESNLNLKISSNERITSLEKEISSQKEEINDLKRELDDVIKLSSLKESAEDDKLLEENASLKKQLSDLLSEVEELTQICEHKENEITTLHDINIQLKEELENYKEILSCKKEELAEASAIHQTLQDKYDCLKAEFDAIKSKPLDDKSQGNSLFAEVDDRRVQLQQNMNKMKTQYLEMKRERANHLKQIATLRNENANLLARWESEANEQEDDDDMVAQSYKNQIRVLKELIESYKQEFKTNSKSEDDGSLRFFDKMLNSKNQEIEALREKLSRNSLNENTLAHDLANARREIRKYKLNVLKLENDIGQLKTEIEELKLPSMPDKLSIKEEQPELKPLVKTEEIIDLVDEPNKENIDRKVLFSENTIEPRVTDRSKYRRGGRILESKPIHIPSVPKQI